MNFFVCGCRSTNSNRAKWPAPPLQEHRKVFPIVIQPFFEFYMKLDAASRFISRLSSRFACKESEKWWRRPVSWAILGGRPTHDLTRPFPFLAAWETWGFGSRFRLRRTGYPHPCISASRFAPPMRRWGRWGLFPYLQHKYE